MNQQAILIGFGYLIQIWSKREFPAYKLIIITYKLECHGALSILGTGHLYSSSSDNVDQLFVYNLNDFRTIKNVSLGGGIMKRPQSGCFSANGHLYIAYDTDEHEKGEIRAYSAINGAYLGSKEIPYDDDVGAGELEGLY